VASGSERELLRDSNMGLAGVSVSPDGAELAYTTYEAATNQSALLRVTLQGRERQELLRRSLPMLVRNVDGWLPDGSGILFTIWNEQQRVATPWVIHRDGGEPRKLELGAGAQWPQVHPDGRRVVFQTSDPVPSQLWMLENLIPRTPSATKAAPR
jgi:Tol biopolymer transport system component